MKKIMKKFVSLLAVVVLTTIVCRMSVCAESGEVIAIATAEELAAISENLSGSYVLTADIDLAGVEWMPIGSFVQAEGSEEEPDMSMAFTGSFDGQGHTISNLIVNMPESWAVGLFGCIANANVGNFTLENAAADGGIMVSDVVGYSFMSSVHDVKLVGGKVTAHEFEMGSEGMYGGIVAAGMASEIVNCSAEADIVVGDNTANAGIIGGGLELTSVSGCYATGTVTAGSNTYGLGGISGCGFGAPFFTDNTAENVMITAGDNCFWIGGITGYAGGYENEEYGVPVTVFTNCAVKNVVIAAEGADGVGEIVGAGFYNEEVGAAMGAPYDQPTVFELVDCVAE